MKGGNKVMKIDKSLVLFLVISLMVVGVYALNPSGATVTPGASSAAPEDAAGNDTNALAGNVTNINLFGFSNTQSWQGYYGNVSGTIQLANANDDVMYNWSLASPKGEVFAANSSSVNWTNIQCFDIATYGASVEELYNISATDVDGINETFTMNNHPLFYVNSKQFDMGVCNNTRLYDKNGQGSHYQVLMTDNGPRIIFTSIIAFRGLQGFDGGSWEFQMIVLEDGHGTDRDTSTYWFWVELE